VVTVRGAHVEVLSLPPDGAEVAAVAFQARYRGRTLDAYRQDLRGFFTWTTALGLHTPDVRVSLVEAIPRPGNAGKLRICVPLTGQS
jgi:hypothetical protein